MLDEMLFFEIRIFKMFCDKAKVSASEGNKLFDSYGIWKYIEDTYEMMHLNGDESALMEVFEVLKATGANTCSLKMVCYYIMVAIPPLKI